MKECELIRLSDGKWSVRRNGVEKAILPALAEIVFDDEDEEDQRFYKNEYAIAAAIERALNQIVALHATIR